MLAEEMALAAEGAAGPERAYTPISAEDKARVDRDLALLEELGALPPLKPGVPAAEKAAHAVPAPVDGTVRPAAPAGREADVIPMTRRLKRTQVVAYVGWGVAAIAAGVAAYLAVTAPNVTARNQNPPNGGGGNEPAMGIDPSEVIRDDCQGDECKPLEDAADAYFHASGSARQTLTDALKAIEKDPKRQAYWYGVITGTGD
jgi:hypothetical protein